MQFIKFIFGLIISGVMVMLPSKEVTAAQVGSAYDYSFTTLLEEDPLPLSQFKGKVLLIVNTASKCGFTKQYEGLEALYKTYKDKGLVILGVPSNDFGKQEPGTAEEIANFCKVNYGVTFPMAAKQVVSGDKAHPFYKWAAQALGFGTSPKWNFHKYLVDKNGHVVDYFNSNTVPDAANFVAAIEKQINNQDKE
jgi:glutathione peroxidase